MSTYLEARLRQLEVDCGVKDWNSYDAEPITQAACGAALAHANYLQFRFPDIRYVDAFPLPDGGICLTFYVFDLGGRKWLYEMDFLADGRMDDELAEDLTSCLASCIIDPSGKTSGYMSAYADPWTLELVEVPTDHLMWYDSRDLLAEAKRTLSS